MTGSTERQLSNEAPGWGLWAGLAVGLPVMGWGVVGALDLATRVRLPDLARYLIGFALVHDLLVVPVVALVGVRLRRIVPSGFWPPLRWALVSSAVVAVVAWPFLRGYGRTPANPSMLDRPYGTGLMALLGVIWLAALLWAIGVQLRQEPGGGGDR